MDVPFEAGSRQELAAAAAASSEAARRVKMAPPSSRMRSRRARPRGVSFGAIQPQVL